MMDQRSITVLNKRKGLGGTVIVVLRTRMVSIWDKITLTKKDLDGLFGKSRMKYSKRVK